MKEVIVKVPDDTRMMCVGIVRLTGVTTLEISSMTSADPEMGIDFCKEIEEKE